MAPGPIPSTLYRPGRRHRIFWPALLRVYCDCSERFFRAYIANERVPAQFNSALLRGSAVHNVLAEVFNGRRSGRADPDELRPLAEHYLPVEP